MSSKLEIATFTPSSALSALRSGAQRIELCAHKNQDGLTPAVKDFSRIYSALDEKPGDHDDGRSGRVEKLINLNFTSLLTSGGAPTSVQGIVQLQKLVRQAAGRIDIIVGGGVRSINLENLMQETGAGWFHSSAVTGDGEEVDGKEVEKMRDILRGARFG
ncbi:copper homeostasis protein cutc [Botrytis cinerea]